MRSLTILHTESSFGWGGQEVRIVTESVGMMARGHRVLLACQADSRMARRAPEYGIETLQTQIGGATDLRGISALRRIIREHDVDLVSTHSSKDSWTGGFAARLAGVKVIRTRHLGQFVRPSSASRYLYGRLPDFVVTTGGVVREHFITDLGVLPEKVVSIPTGLDLDCFDPDQADGQVFRRELGIGPGEILIGTLGMLRRAKGNSYLIEAASKIIKEVPEARFVLVGDIAFDSPIKDRLSKEITDRGLAGKVLMPGFRSDVPNVLAALDVFVHPSLTEGVSQAISQALAMRRPIVATDVGSTREQIVHEETGLLVESANSEELASAILRILKDEALAKRMGQNGREHVRQHFSLQCMLDATERVYASLFSDHS